MNLCGDRDRSWGGSWLLEALCRDRSELCVSVGCKPFCRERPELWVIVGYMKLCVDKDLNCV